LYIGIGLALVTAIVIYVQAVGSKNELPFKWIMLFAETPVAFSIPIKSSKKRWRQPAFWLVLLGLFVLHCLGFAVILLKVNEWQGVWFVPSTVIEVIGLSIILNKFFPPWRTPRQ
jgi:hypothetical protein